MAATKKPYEQFGPYILFRKLESDALGDLWRAGRIEGNALGPIVALRRLSGGNREAFVQAAESGVGVFEMDSSVSAAERELFIPIIEWADPEYKTRAAGKVIELARPNWATSSGRIG